VLIVGGVVLAVAALVVIFSPFSGSGAHGSTSKGATAPAKARAHAHGHKSASSAAKAAPAVVNPAEINVVVLNGTEVTGAAHRISAELGQSGYTRATPLDGRPPGANQVSVVQYVSGHQAEAQAVARTLGVALAAPIEPAVASLAGPATVVVIVGLDKATTAP
jgi:hypothetical protein